MFMCVILSDVLIVDTSKNLIHLTFTCMGFYEFFFYSIEKSRCMKRQTTYISHLTVCTDFWKKREIHLETYDPKIQILGAGKW